MLHRILTGSSGVLLLMACSSSQTAFDVNSRSGSDVLEHHARATRDGFYVAPSLTPQAAAGLRLDSAFNGSIQGPVYAQPLFVSNGPQGKSALIAATEQNWVYALDGTSGTVIWSKMLGTPVPLSKLPCGNIDPLGITGTPVVDLTSRTIYLDAMTTPDGGTTKRHLVFALSLDFGTTKPGWPVDLSATVTSDGTAFDSSVQNQRGALALINGVLYVPFGGHFGDCGSYHGWVVGVPVTNPSSPMAWRTQAESGAVWAPGGVVYDGSSIFVATGNTAGATTWGGGEAILRLGPGPTFSESPADFFTPADWQALDTADLDIGGTQPVPIDLPGATPSQLVLSLGKNGKAYLVDRTHLGGIGGQLATLSAAQDEIITAPASYMIGDRAFVAFKGKGAGCPAGQSGDLTALAVTPGAPPTMSVVWCATQNGLGSPIVTSPDGVSSPIVWSVGAEGDNRLHGFNATTGQVIFNGGGPSDAMESVRRYQSPISAAGALYVAGDRRIYRFKPGS